MLYVCCFAVHFSGVALAREHRVGTIIRLTFYLGMTALLSVMVILAGIARHYWYITIHLLLLVYLWTFAAYRFFWPRGEEYPSPAGMQLDIGWIFCHWGFTYAGIVFLHYLFAFDPKGTWKDDWTESLP